ncbi:protealysin inhibitor emfourin [Modicisalibacter luteus]|uniref:Protealysin inhibitor emfourin n=1 Tax=Modicisalibacter luteus TaxID=453962 RepID=A0ABV7LZW8_9GAMM|nr:protealysin inhibitor emfourin [Halomonas lutea]GHA95526.1 hypothetical protein GCM10007159_16200 [Halomonas lutea]
MSQSTPRLGPHSVLLIRREGGIAHFPGLASPRRIRCAQCTEEQRQWIQSLLEQAGQYLDIEGGADRRRFCLEITEEDASTSPTWTLSFDESQAPAALIRLWQHGMLEE